MSKEKIDKKDQIEEKKPKVKKKHLFKKEKS